jgi:mono/diheme cytochrome c family protein
MKRLPVHLAIIAVFSSLAAGSEAPDQAAVERGRNALLSRSHIESRWTIDGFHKLEKPDASAIRDRYGLFPTPYDNDGLPMGLRRRNDDPKHIVLDCMICHGGSLFGKSYVGLPNTTNDLQPLFRDLTKASKLQSPPELLTVNRTRGLTNAGALGVLFMAFRNDDLSTRTLPLALGWHKFPDIDAPAWWLLKKKRTMYCDGGMDAESTRSIMQFLLVPGRAKEKVTAAEPVWDDIRRFILSIEPPKYPFEINQEKASEGKAIFAERCAGCHGTYGVDGVYPNKIVPIGKVGTDRVRFDAITDAARNHYNKTWYGEKHSAKKTAGYQAPLLDGVWATAPYFHNGSVPTVYHVLNSKARPKTYRRKPPDDRSSYDAIRLGWKFDEVPPPIRFGKAEDRGLYDSRRFGAGVDGHTFGDDLTDQERFAVVEYLKTL